VALEDWRVRAAELLQVRREIVRVEWRDAAMRLVAHAETPYRGEYWSDNFREESETHAVAACTNARRTNAATYSPSYFQLLGEGLGTELMEVCQPLQEKGHVVGYVLGTYSLPNILSPGGQEPDAHPGGLVHRARRHAPGPGGGGLARRAHVHGPAAAGPAGQHAGAAHGQLAPRAQRLPECDDGAGDGHVDRAGDVLVVLVRDNRRRLRAERDLGDALAFRKAMEDSLVTGMRARDLQGRITYVNPAFCNMVGFSAEELLGLNVAPYWPPELAQEYRQRQGRRLSAPAHTARGP
jgi:two-component system sensor histidine kinase DctS